MGDDESGAEELQKRLLLHLFSSPRIDQIRGSLNSSAFLLPNPLLEEIHCVCLLQNFRLNNGAVNATRPSANLFSVYPHTIE